MLESATFMLRWLRPEANTPPTVMSWENSINYVLVGLEIDNFLAPQVVLHAEQQVECITQGLTLDDRWKTSTRGKINGIVQGTGA